MLLPAYPGPYKCIDAEKHHLTLKEGPGIVARHAGPFLRQRPACIAQASQTGHSICPVQYLQSMFGGSGLRRKKIKGGVKCSDAESLHRTLAGTS